MPSKLQHRQRWAADIMAGKTHPRPFPWTGVKQAIEASGVPQERLTMQDIPAIKIPESPTLFVW